MPDRFGDKARIMHVIDSIKEIQGYLGSENFEGFTRNSMMMDACIRQLGIIGEACNRISEEIKSKYMDVKWRQIIGLRNLVIHEYFGVDDRIIWDVITDHLPELYVQMKNILLELDEK